MTPRTSPLPGIEYQMSLVALNTQKMPSAQAAMSARTLQAMMMSGSMVTPSGSQNNEPTPAVPYTAPAPATRRRERGQEAGGDEMS